jgi:hypothetical protein
VSKVWEQQDSPGLQAHALVSANVWHPSPFVRSLQLVIHRIWNPRDGLAESEKKKLIAALHGMVWRLMVLNERFFAAPPDNELTAIEVFGS